MIATARNNCVHSFLGWSNAQEATKQEIARKNLLAGDRPARKRYPNAFRPGSPAHAGIDPNERGPAGSVLRLQRGEAYGPASSATSSRQRSRYASAFSVE